VVTGAFLRRSLAEQTMRWTPLFFDAAAFAAGLFTQAYLGRLVDATPNAALGDYAGRFAAFLILGVALLDLQTAVVGGLSQRIREAQHSGSLETVLTTPAPTWTLLLGMALPDVAWALGRLVVYALVGTLLFGLDPRAANLGAALVVFVLTTAAFAALALIGAAITMILRRGNPLTLFLTMASMIAGGVIYPRQILPRALEWTGALLPIAAGLDGLRAAIVHGQLAGEPLARLLGFTLAGLPLGAWLFARSLARARDDGSLTSS
jgi:ABC-2 type transport system permease protein